MEGWKDGRMEAFRMEGWDGPSRPPYNGHCAAQLYVLWAAPLRANVTGSMTSCSNSACPRESVRLWYYGELHLS